MKKNSDRGTPGKDQFLTLPNILTLLRLALVPVFLFLSLRRQALGTLLIFTAAGLTDFLDGATARLFHLRTKIGTLLDPIADKALMATAFLVLTFQCRDCPSSIPLWLTASVLGRDFLIVSGAWFIYRSRGYKNFPPSLLGKINTVFQVMTVFLVLFYNLVQTDTRAQSFFLSGAASLPLLSTLFLLTLASTVLSGIHYVIRGANLFFSSSQEDRPGLV